MVANTLDSLDLQKCSMCEEAHFIDCHLLGFEELVENTFAVFRPLRIRLPILGD